MDFAQTPMNSVQPGMSGTAAKPNPADLIRQIAMMRIAQSQQSNPTTPPMPR